MIHKTYLTILAFWSLLLLSFQAKATHALGSDLTYTCVNNATGTYEVRLSIYRDCRGINLGSTARINQAGCGMSGTVNLQRVSIIDVTQTCSIGMTACNGGMGAEGVELHEYVGIVTLDPNCANHTLSYRLCCRPNSNTTLVNPGGEGFYTETQILSNNTLCNNSVESLNSPIFYTCAGMPTSYTHGAFDSDGDSLVFSLTPAYSNNNTTVGYHAQFSGTNPLSTVSGFVIDPQTGTMSFTPTPGVAQSAVVSVQIEEYRNGVLIGVNFRELAIIVTPNCNNNPVLLDSVLTYENGAYQPLNGNVFDACPGQSLNFKLYLSDLDTSQTISIRTLYSSLLNSFPDALLTTTYPNNPLKNRLIVEVQIPRTQNRAFSLTFTDNACPIPSIRSYGFLSSSANTDCAIISGRVAIDSNSNCVVENGEKVYREVFVIAEKPGFTTFARPDGFGRYELPVDTGNYTVNVFTMHPYWGSCMTGTTTSLPTYASKDTIDIPVDAIVDCPLMEVNIGAPRLISCRQNYYSVNYCNTGTDTAFASYVEVTLDSLFTIDSTTLPIASQTGFTYTFNLGDIGVNECGSFRIYATLDSLCDTTNFGDTYCALARIYPDSFCLTSPQWSGADLMVEAQCNTDSVSFRIQNKGVSAMPSAQTLWVIEDNIIFHSQPFNLGAGASTPWYSYYADGSTYRMQTEQVPNHPWQAQVSAVVEGCLASNSASTTTSTGFVNIFSMNDDAPWESIDCQVALNSWDPNDKTGFPLGYGAQHYIEDDTKMRYRVRFQNTGTAPALDVVILDTLSPHLDVFSIKMGAASHPYTWTILNDNVLKFTFSNINLPDSASNEPASHGFVDYKIEQQPNNPIGTVINNSAAIYFDLNPPVITNTTFHTIGDNFVQVVITSQDDILAENAAPKVRVFPNPFGDVATFEILDHSNYQEVNLMIYDITGQQVRSIQANNQQQILLERGDLSQGVYLFRIEADNQLLETGKLIVK